MMTSLSMCSVQVTLPTELTSNMKLYHYANSRTQIYGNMPDIAASVDENLKI